MRFLLLAALLLTAAPAAPALADATTCHSFAATLPPIVRKSAIAAVDESYDIHLYSFCRGYQFHDTGNAGGLIRTIANNPVLVAAIKDADWQAAPDDVKYVQIIGNDIYLWLHRDPR
jgi:hypothetical protein